MAENFAPTPSMFIVFGLSFQSVIDQVANRIEQILPFIPENLTFPEIIVIFTSLGAVLFFLDKQLGFISAILEKCQKTRTQWSRFWEGQATQETELLKLRQKLLKAFTIKLEKRLRDILSDDQLIALSYAQRHDVINRPEQKQVTPAESSRQEPQWQTRLKSLDPRRWLLHENEEPAELAPEEKLIDVFWREHGRLFILGAPGSGKTTTLLELAQELVEAAKADQDNAQLIPIIFELSNWKSDQQSIEEFLAAQLKEEFQISIDIGEYWVKTNQILPLFDGLDEVSAIRLPLSVEKLNEFLQGGESDRLAVVCCWAKEFKLGRETLYRLNGSVELQGLSDGQIQQYLQAVKQPNLWEQKIKPSPELTDLARTPLMLTVMAVALSNQLPTTRTELFTAYIQERFERYKNKCPKEVLAYSSEQTCQYLQRLAWQLKNGGKTAFLIEGLQPKAWLQKKQEQVIYGLIYGLIVGLIFGLIYGLIVGLTYGLIGVLMYSLVGALGYGMIGALIGTLMYRLISGLVNKLEPINILDFSWKRVSPRKFFNYLIDGLIYGLIYGLIIRWILGLVVGLIDGLIYGLMLGLMLGLINGLQSDITIRSQPNQGIFTAVKNSIIFTCFGGILAVLINLFLPALLINIVPDLDQIESIVRLNMVSALIVPLLFSGGTAWIQHLALRVALWRSGAMPWNYAAFLAYTSELRLTRQTGGEFRFLHDLLREYFAESYTNPDHSSHW